MPFAGITHHVTELTPSELTWLTTALSLCHRHNFAVSNDPPSLYVSEQAAHCAADHLRSYRRLGPSAEMEAPDTRPYVPNLEGITFATEHGRYVAMDVDEDGTVLLLEEGK